MKKYDDPNRASVNDASTRPFVFAKFSDVYLIAAEAYFKIGDNANAAAMLNVLRQRAAFGTTNPGGLAAAIAAQTITPAQVTLDFILDERTRELFGECQRWWDLVRTQTLSERLCAMESDGSIYPLFGIQSGKCVFSAAHTANPD